MRFGNLGGERRESELAVMANSPMYIYFFYVRTAGLDVPWSVTLFSVSWSCVWGFLRLRSLILFGLVVLRCPWVLLIWYVVVRILPGLRLGCLKVLSLGLGCGL